MKKEQSVRRQKCFKKMTTKDKSMKTKLQTLFLGLALLAGIHPALAQNPVITSFSQNGELVCSNLAAGSVATVFSFCVFTL